MSKEKNGTAVVVREPREIIDVSPADAKKKLEEIRQFQGLVKTQMIEGLDYGKIPGVERPTLLKPGAEKIIKLLGLQDFPVILEKIEDWDKPFFHYLVRVDLTDYRTGIMISSGLGEANSKESKWGWRWVKEQDIPANLDAMEKSDLKTKGSKRTIFEPTFAVQNKETTGKYGKKVEYWASWDKAIKEGRARKAKKTMGKGDKAKEYEGYEVEIDETLFRIPNDQIFDLVNTLLKMSEKRALVDAALHAGRLSDIFTQDIEDITGEPGVSGPEEETHEGPPTQETAPPEEKKKEANKPRPKKDEKPKEASPAPPAGPSNAPVPRASVAPPPAAGPSGPPPVDWPPAGSVSAEEAPDKDKEERAAMAKKIKAELDKAGIKETKEVQAFKKWVFSMQGPAEKKYVDRNEFGYLSFARGSLEDLKVFLNYLPHAIKIFRESEEGESGAF